MDTSSEKWKRKASYDEEKPYAKTPVFRYSFFHAIYFIVEIVFAYLFFHNHYLHLAWILFLFSYTLWNGATRYYKMMTTYYTKTMIRLVK